MSKLRSWFFTGILVLTPAILTVYVVWSFITFVDNLVVPIVPDDYQPSNFLPFSLPGLGLIIVFIVTTFIGSLATGLFGRTLIKLWENILNRMPVVRSVYSAIKQILEIMGDRPAVICRELTKMHEEIIRGTLSSLLELLESKTFKGECVLLIGKDDGTSPERDRVSTRWRRSVGKH